MSWGDPGYGRAWLSLLEQTILTINYLNLTADLRTLIRLYCGLLGALDVPFTLLQVQPLIFSLLLTIDLPQHQTRDSKNVATQGLLIPWKLVRDINLCLGWFVST
jgi:hypothetical protein